MSDDRIGLEDLTDDEALALGGLLRAMVSLDGSFSPDEHDALRKLAEDLGEDRFWAIMQRASEDVKDGAHVKELAEGVERQPARELIFEAVYTAGQADTISKNEMAMLDELRAMWNVDDGGSKGGD